MKTRIGLTVFFIASLLNVMPVSATQTLSSASSDSVIASAKATPAQASQLSFLISAPVKEINVKEGDLVQAGDVLIALNAPDLAYAVLAAQQAVNAAILNAELQNADEVKYVNPITGRVSFYPLPKEAHLIALSKADQTQALLNLAQANFAQSVLIAPFHGTVASLNVEVGELVQAHQTVLTLATLDNLQIVTTDLSERAITRINIGQRVQVYIEALDTTVTGKVVRISPIAENVGGDVVFPVVIQLDEQPEGLLWGMSAEVEIETK